MPAQFYSAVPGPCLWVGNGDTAPDLCKPMTVWERQYSTKNSVLVCLSICLRGSGTIRVVTSLVRVYVSFVRKTVKHGFGLCTKCADCSACTNSCGRASKSIFREVSAPRHTTVERVESKPTSRDKSHVRESIQSHGQKKYTQLAYQWRDHS